MKSTDDWVLEKNSIFGKNRDPCSGPSKEAPQVQEEEIGRSPHGFVGDQHQDDKDIPNHADREDKAEKKFPVENSWMLRRYLILKKIKLQPEEDKAGVGNVSWKRWYLNLIVSEFWDTE